MRIRFAFSCLLGASILFTSSASTVIEANSSVAAPVQQLPTEPDRASSRAVSKAVNDEPFGAVDAPPSEASPLEDNDAPTEDFKNVKTPTTLERARAALAGPTLLLSPNTRFARAWSPLHEPMSFRLDSSPT